MRGAGGGDRRAAAAVRQLAPPFGDSTEFTDRDHPFFRVKSWAMIDVVRARGRHRSASRPSRAARPAAAAGVLLGGLLLSSAFAGVTIQENALGRTIDQRNAEINAEQAKNTQLQASAAEKQSTDYIVEKAKQLGWVWPWEALIAVQRNADANAKSATKTERPSSIARWIALFIGKT